MVTVFETLQDSDWEDLSKRMDTPATRQLQQRMAKLENKVERTPVTVQDIDRLINDTHAFYAAKGRTRKAFNNIDTLQAVW